jgi:uncharacterized metal-binding protein YceD (DUF177 family)
MFAELDRVLEPAALAARDWQLTAEDSLTGWPRLAALDSEAAADGAPGRAARERTVQIQAACRRDDTGAPVLEAELGAVIRAVCQRCLESMELKLRASPRLAFGAEREGEAAGGFEFCEMEAGTTLRKLFEDELLLAVPPFPTHERSEDCGALAAKLAEFKPAEGGQKSSSPFAVLAELKRKD